MRGNYTANGAKINRWAAPSCGAANSTPPPELPLGPAAVPGRSALPAQWQRWDAPATSISRGLPRTQPPAGQVATTPGSTRRWSYDRDRPAQGIISAPRTTMTLLLIPASS